jgi:hypothetical protein
MAGIKPLAGKLIFIAFALVMFFLGTSYFTLEIAPLSTIVVLFVAALILFIEQGLKKLLPPSFSSDTLKNMSITDWITVALIVVLVITAFAGIFWSMPAWLLGISDFAIAVSAFWVAAQAFV